MLSLKDAGMISRRIYYTGFEKNMEKPDLFKKMF